MKKNIPLDTDAYKWTHPWQYPKGLDGIDTSAEARIGSLYDSIWFVGLQGIVEEYLSYPVTDADIDEAEEDCISTMGYKQYFNREVWEKVRDIGYLPMEIKAIPEGLEIPKGVIPFKLKATEPWFAKTVQSLETVLMHWWYPSAVCTRSGNIKKGIKPLFDKSCDFPGIMDFLVQDFGSRGTTCPEQSAWGGMAHLVHFQGSDNNTANKYIRDYYGFKGRAKSVWATEHSVAMAFGPGQGEFDYVNHQLDNAPDDAIISVVGDTYDIINFTENVVSSDEIRKKILARAGKFVVRPDSGDFWVIVPQLFEILERKFGYTLNTKGYKLLNKTGVLQGDKMEEETIIGLYTLTVDDLHLAAENLVVGSGGGLLQVDLNRDTIAAAIKPNKITIDGVRKNIQKNPKSQSSKKSKTGDLKTVRKDGIIQTISDIDTPDFDSYVDMMIPIWKDGKFIKKYIFPEVIANAALSFV